jgi:hypothetical protein
MSVSSSSDRRPVAVVLSPDADEVLTSFDKETVYIVPGVIDRTVTSEISLSLARRVGLPARRLPIQEFIPERQTHVLNIDTVMKIFCLYSEHAGDWETTLREALPKRKQKQKRLGRMVETNTFAAATAAVANIPAGMDASP